jgi:hypothetical protein
MVFPQCIQGTEKSRRQVCLLTELPLQGLQLLAELQVLVVPQCILHASTSTTTWCPTLPRWRGHPYAA